MIRLEILDERSRADVLRIDRSDVPEAMVDSIPHILELTQYGLDHGCIGHTFAIYAGDACVGVLLMGEGIPWPCAPPEVAGVPFYRIMGFVVDRSWRGRGIGATALEMAITRIYGEYGPRPILLGVQEDNARATAFYLQHGFRPTDAMDEDDRFYVRWGK